MRVKLVMMDANGAEKTLGPFNQGVCVEVSQVAGNPVPVITDVATRERVAQLYGLGWVDDGLKFYKQAFVQAMVEGEEIR